MCIWKVNWKEKTQTLHDWNTYSEIKVQPHGEKSTLQKMLMRTTAQPGLATGYAGPWLNIHSDWHWLNTAAQIWLSQDDCWLQFNLNIYHMHIGPVRAVSENTTVSLLIAKNAARETRSRCCILLLMSQGVRCVIYVKPADANESQFSEWKKWKHM